MKESKLHFNRQGIRVFAENVSGFLTKLNSHHHQSGNILTKVSCKEFQPDVSNFNDSLSLSKDISSNECKLLFGTVNSSDRKKF